MLQPGGRTPAARQMPGEHLADGPRLAVGEHVAPCRGLRRTVQRRGDAGRRVVDVRRVDERGTAVEQREPSRRARSTMRPTSSCRPAPRPGAGGSRRRHRSESRCQREQLGLGLRARVVAVRMPGGCRFGADAGEGRAGVGDRGRRHLDEARRPRRAPPRRGAIGFPRRSRLGTRPPPPRARPSRRDGPRPRTVDRAGDVRRIA